VAVCFGAVCCGHKRTRSEALLSCTGPKMSEFRKLLAEKQPAAIDELRSDVEQFAKQFPTVGFEQSTMRYKD
jgi:hypothetical protein